MNKNGLNLVLLLTGGYGFPIGDAYTNRILAFAKGLIKNGCKVTILIVYPGRNNIANKKGVIDGIEYFFCTETIWPKKRIHKMITGGIGILNSIHLLNVINKDKKIDAIISFSQQFTQNFPVFVFSRFHRILFIRENNEFPRLILKRGNTNLKPIERLYFKMVNRFFDGYIYISTALVEFNRPLIGKRMPVIIVPIIVDDQRFNCNNFNAEPLITYCGNLYGEKDGIRILLESFARVHAQIPDYKLMLIGDTNNESEYKSLLEYIQLLGIAQKVLFTGFIHRDEVPNLLKKSSLLVLARPNNMQAKGGFPTKLGEYLATGRPVLVTKVSDIPTYITDGVNGYLSEPDSVEDFSRKLFEILSNYENAVKVGREGRKLTESVFSNVYQSKRILNYIMELST